MRVALTLALVAASFGCFGQRVTITGTQYRQLEQDARLECDGRRITHTMVIDSVSGNCDGFWIMRGVKGDKPVMAFKSARHLPEAKGQVLKPDTYYIYPNMYDEGDSVSVTIWLKRK